MQVGGRVGAINTRGGTPAFRKTAMQIALQTTLVPEKATGSGTPTFTRNLAAYVEDFESRLVLVPADAARCAGCRIVKNYLATIDFSTGWTLSNLTRGTGISDPDGGTSAYSLTATAINAEISKPSALSLANGVQGLSSIYMRRRTGTGTINFYTANDVTPVDITSRLTSSWKRFSTAAATGGAGTGYIDIVITTSGDAIDVYHPQVENVTGQTNQAPGEFVNPTVDYGVSSGSVKGLRYFDTLNGNTVSSNVVTEATGAKIVAGQAGVAATAPVDSSGPFGYLSEQASTQIIPTTADIRDMTTANWTAGVTVTVARTSVGADGVANSANRVTGGAVTATNTITYLITAAASSRTYSAMVKRVTGTGPIQIMQGATISDISSQLVAGVYRRVSLNASVLNATIGFRVDTNADAIDVDMNMFEAGAVATSGIITGGATRPADVEQGVSAGNISSTATTISMSLTPSTELGSTTVFHWGTYVDADNYTAILSDGTNLIARKRISGSNHDATTAWSRTVNTAVKVAARFDSTNGVDVWLSGVKGTGDTTTTASQIGTNFQNGADGNGSNQDNCEHRFLQFWTRSLPDAQLITLTS